MKKNFIETMSIAAVCLMLLIGCKSKPEHQFSESDVEKIAAWNKLLVSKPSLSSANDQPVCHTYADACTLKYKTAYEHAADVSAISAAYTYSEDFGSKNLSDWAQDIAKNTNATTIKMCFGIYTQAFVTAFPSAKPNRLAVFLYPVAADGTVGDVRRERVASFLCENHRGDHATR